MINLSHYLLAKYVTALSKSLPLPCHMKKKNENNERNVHSNTTSLQKENCKIYAHFGMKLYFVLGRLAYKNSVRHINSNTNVRHINSNTNS